MTYCKILLKSDILHIIVSPYYDENHPIESYWNLIGERKLKLRFLKNAPKLPKLAFLQSQIKPYNNVWSFLSILYNLGINQVIGNLWPMKDATFPLNFYYNLFNGIPANLAMQETKKHYSQDFTCVQQELLYMDFSSNALIVNNQLF